MAMISRPRLLTLCILLAVVGGADTAPTTQLVAPPNRLKPYQYPIGAGVLGLAAGSTDVIIADVLTTNPDRAIEGARDNLKLKVVEVLMGRPVVGETLDLCYHLLWTDRKLMTLEPPKFGAGKRYIIFLRSHVTDRVGTPTVEYELADQWLAVMPPDSDRLAEVEGAIRAAQGDARGAWCEPVAQYRGRLLAYRAAEGGRPVIDVFLDLNNVTAGDSEVLFDLSHATITWTVTDGMGKVIEPNAPAGKRAKEGADQKVLLKPYGTVRVPLSQTDGDFPESRRGYLTLTPGLAWSFNTADRKTLFLKGRIVIPFVDRDTWFGTMELPPIVLPND